MFSILLSRAPGNLLAVQWLGLGTFTAEGTGGIPGWGTKTPQPVQCSQTNKQKRHQYNDILKKRKKNKTVPFTYCSRKYMPIHMYLYYSLPVRITRFKSFTKVLKLDKECPPETSLKQHTYWWNSGSIFVVKSGISQRGTFYHHWNPRQQNKTTGKNEEVQLV